MKRGLVILAMTLVASASAFAQVESTDLGEPGTPPPKAKTETPAKQSPPPATQSKTAEEKPKSTTTKSSHSRKVAAFWIIVP